MSPVLSLAPAFVKHGERTWKWFIQSSWAWYINRWEDKTRAQSLNNKRETWIMVWWRENESSVGLAGTNRGPRKDGRQQIFFCPKQNLEDTQEVPLTWILNPERLTNNLIALINTSSGNEADECLIIRPYFLLPLTHRLKQDLFYWSDWMLLSGKGHQIIIVEGLGDRSVSCTDAGP